MRVLRSILREIVSLFVDDGSFALAIVAWVFAGALCVRLHVDPVFEAVLLFLGLAVILAESVWRSARERPVSLRHAPCADPASRSAR
jgi:hypothetical protein